MPFTSVRPRFVCLAVRPLAALTFVALLLVTSPAWAQEVPAGMLTPSPETTLSGPAVTFTWTSGTEVTDIWLDVGTTVGGAQIYAAAQTQLSQTVTTLPTDGSPVYVRVVVADGDGLAVDRLHVRRSRSDAHRPDARHHVPGPRGDLLVDSQRRRA